MKKIKYIKKFKTYQIGFSICGRMINFLPALFLIISTSCFDTFKWSVQFSFLTVTIGILKLKK